jgi:hypothetical protein
MKITKRGSIYIEDEDGNLIECPYMLFNETEDEAELFDSD